MLEGMSDNDRSSSCKANLVGVGVRVASGGGVRRAEGELQRSRRLGLVASDAAVAARAEHVSRGDRRVGVGVRGECEQRAPGETQRARGLVDAADRVGEPDASGTEAEAAGRVRARLARGAQSKRAPALRQLFGTRVLRATARCVHTTYYMICRIVCDQLASEFS